MALALLTCPLHAATLIVDSRCNIFGSGHSAPNDTPQPDGGGGGIPPVSFSFSPAAGRILTFSSITGMINVNFGGDASPDGLAAVTFTNLNGPWNGISAATFEMGHRPILSIRVSQVSQVELCWDTITNASYQLQYRSTLTTNPWSPLATNWVIGTGMAYCTNDAVPFGQPQRFYQVAVTNSPP